MQTTGGNRFPFTGSADLNRHIIATSGVIAQLTIHVITPGKKGPILCKPQGVILTGGNCSPVRAGAGLDGGIGRYPVAVTQLPIAVVTPRPECAVSTDCQRMIFSGSNFRPGTPLANLYRYTAVS